MSKNSAPCNFDACPNGIKAKGLCIRHYGQQLEGKQLTSLRRYAKAGADARSRMDDYTDKSGECWLWQGPTMNAGYGLFFFDGKRQLAHRAAYEIAHGDIADGLLIDHTCHTKLCVRPEHLQAVTHKLNMENRRGPQARTKSGERGVYWHSASGLWHAAVGHDGRKVSGGYFNTVREAAQAAAALRRRVLSNSVRDAP